jgi:hypothetical protein
MIEADISLSEWGPGSTPEYTSKLLSLIAQARPPMGIAIAALRHDGRHTIYDFLRNAR